MATVPAIREYPTHVVVNDLDWLSVVVIRNREECQGVAETVGQINKRIKMVEDWFGPRKAQARQTWQQIVDDEKMFLAPLVKAKAIGSAAMARFEKEERDRAAEETARLQLETGLTTIAVRPEKTQGTVTVKTWKFEITDASAVPRQFLMVDEKAIRAYVTANKDKAVIPGVRVFEDVSVRVKGGE